MRALAFTQECNSPLGRLDAALARRGVAVDLVHPDEIASLPGPAEYDLVIPLGSDHSAYDDSVSWIRAELSYLRDAIRADVPVLGICFGSQILARALGAEVRKAPAPEVGWSRIQRTTSWIPEGPWFVWHEDVFSWPEGATRLGWTGAAPQAFRQGGHLGLQFHPEATPDIVESWLDESSGRLLRQGVDVDALRRETRVLEVESDAATLALFDAYLDDVLVARAPGAGLR